MSNTIVSPTPCLQDVTSAAAALRNDLAVTERDSCIIAHQLQKTRRLEQVPKVFGICLSSVARVRSLTIAQRILVPLACSIRPMALGLRLLAVVGGWQVFVVQFDQNPDRANRITTRNLQVVPCLTPTGRYIKVFSRVRARVRHASQCIHGANRQTLRYLHQVRGSTLERLLPSERAALQGFPDEDQEKVLRGLTGRLSS
jgi:hypothetical protein